MPVIKYRESAGEPWTKLYGIVGPAGPAGADGSPGAAGKDGINGKDGKDGKTPVKGVDYMTEEDITDIALAALELIASGEEIEY